MRVAPSAPNFLGIAEGFFVLFSLAHPCNIVIQVGAGAVVASEFLIETATEVADIALGADEEDGHLEGAATDGEEADDVTLLFGHGLVGLVFGILLLKGSEEFGILTINLVAEGLPLLSCWVGVLR